MQKLSRREVFHELRRAIEFYQQEKFTQAFNLLSKISKHWYHPHLETKILPLKMNCLLQVGNLEAARDYIEEMTTRYPTKPLYIHEAARYYHKTGDYDRANRYYLRTICLAPDRIDYALAYSHFLRERHAPEKSISVLIRCLRENRKRKPTMPLLLLYQELGLIYYQKKFYLRALILFQHCSNSWKDFSYRDLLADCYLQRRRYKECLVTIEEHLLQWGENDADALYIKAKALAALERRDEAIRCLYQCQKIWGELVVTGSDLAHLYCLVQDGSLRKIPHVTLLF
ncbi:MAG: hypothetical protein NZM25_06125 [Leptospiraceae bacterium]|nr:hypothetical protein [Leptospiraceae bacterium]MDW8306648.1 hypothetical protein [Leptospiraceae bacterium]